jgi:uncharacterized phage protein (TIGR01671 family)
MREIKFRAWVKKFHNPDYEAWAKQKEDSYFYGRNKSRVTVYEEETNNSFNKGFVCGMDYYPVISEGYYAVMNGCEISGENENVPLMQFTGLLDRNGKEIYEGDVVEYQYLNTLEQEVRKAEVKLLSIGDVNRNITAYYPFCYSISGSYKERDREITECYLTPANDCEVIGNIYENPELLT